MFPDPALGEQHRRSLWIAAYVTILLAPILYVAFEVAVAAIEHGRIEFAPGTGQIYLMLICIGLVASTLIMIVIGLPLVFALRRMGRLTGPWVRGAGAVAGMAGMAAVMFLFSALPDREVLALGAGLGLACGAVFGLVAGLRWRS